MTKDIYVVQKTAEEGKQLEDWCIQNDVTVNMNYGLGFNPEWNCFAYLNSIDAFCKNYELSSCKLNMQEVTIEEFKRLQLESLGKIPLRINSEEVLFKPGDWVKTKSGKTNPFELQQDNFPIKNGLLAGFKVYDLAKCEKPVKSEFIVGKWYKSNVASSKDYYIKVKNVIVLPLISTKYSPSSGNTMLNKVCSFSPWADNNNLSSPFI